MDALLDRWRLVTMQCCVSFEHNRAIQPVRARVRAVCIHTHDPAVTDTVDRETSSTFIKDTGQQNNFQPLLARACALVRAFMHLHRHHR